VPVSMKLIRIHIALILMVSEFIVSSREGPSSFLIFLWLMHFQVRVLQIFEVIPNVFIGGLLVKELIFKESHLLGKLNIEIVIHFLQSDLSVVTFLPYEMLLLPAMDQGNIAVSA